MSELKKKDLHTPFNNKTIEKLMAVLRRKESHQAAAADLTDTFVASHDGKWYSAFIILDQAFKKDETMTVDIQVNGVSILPGGTPQELDDTSPAKCPIIIAIDPAKSAVVVGDKISVIRNWTTSGVTDATPANVIGLEW